MAIYCIWSLSIDHQRRAINDWLIDYKITQPHPIISCWNKYSYLKQSYKFKRKQEDIKLHELIMNDEGHFDIDPFFKFVKFSKCLLLEKQIKQGRLPRFCQWQWQVWKYLSWKAASCGNDCRFVQSNLNNCKEIFFCQLNFWIFSRA